MLEYDNPLLNVFEALENSYESRIVDSQSFLEARMDKPANSNNAFHSGYTVREFSDLPHFLTAIRPERLKTKIKNWPADFDIEFVNPKTCDRLQIGLHYPDATRAEMVVVLYKTVDIYNRAISRGFRVKNPVYDAVKWEEKRVVMRDKAEAIQKKIQGIVNKLKTAKYRVLDPDEDFLDIIANSKPYEYEEEW